MFNILIAEDNESTSKLLSALLSHNGYTVYEAKNGIEALEVLDRHQIDLIVLDIMMPHMDGYEFLQELRSVNNTTLILILTAKQLQSDKNKGLRAGADDYMIKPFDNDELLLRIKALLRRAKIANEHKLYIGQVCVDYGSFTVTRGDEVFTLPPKEFQLLYILLSNPNHIYTRIQLMDEIWGMDTESMDTTINVHIHRLRKKFENFAEFEIRAIRGIGYKAVIHGE